MEKAYASIFVEPEGDFVITYFNGFISQLETLKTTRIEDVIFSGERDEDINVEITYENDGENLLDWYVTSIIEVKE